MPTILSHPAVPLAVAWGLGRVRVPKRLLLAGVAASVAPDLDVIVFGFGIPWGHDLAHRGATHSLGAALLAGLLAAVFAGRLGTTAGRAFLFVAASMASHSVLDMFTNGGSGIELFWPGSSSRWFMPWRPIEVSPIGLTAFLGTRGLEVLRSELLWVWIPALGACAALLLGRSDLRRR